MKLDAIIASVREHGFAIIGRHLAEEALVLTRRRHIEALVAAEPQDTARSACGSNTRSYLAAHGLDLDLLYLDPALLAVAAGVIEAPFKLSAFLSRTVHPGASAQALHVDLPRGSGAPTMLGFIYMLDDFRADNGATRFVPGSHRGSTSADAILATAPAGSLLVYDGATLHGFSDSTSDGDRRSIQGAFVTRSTPSVTARPWHFGRNDLARYLLGEPRQAARHVDISHLITAIEASWDHRTAWQGNIRAGNPAFGQCYPTARVVQWFYPAFEIACGDVWTGKSVECHFWNLRGVSDELEQIDLSWKQFSAGSTVQEFKILDRATLGDSAATIERCDLLLQRVLLHLAGRQLLPSIVSEATAV